MLIPQLISDTTAVTSFIANSFFSNNLHEVVPGKFYRSAEMKVSEMVKVAKANGIKTVVDLRLSNEEVDSEGRSEEQALKDAGISYRHIPFNSGRDNQLPRVKELLTAYSEIEQPILVHCSSGTHRAGLASAIWLLEQENKNIDAANEQFSPKYGFFQRERDLKALYEGRPTLDAIFWRYKDANAKTPVRFRDWLEMRLAELTGK